MWVTLRESLDERALYAEAVRQGVSFTPGGATLVDPGTGTSFRLSFSLAGPDELEEGARRLGRAIRSLRRRHAPPPSLALS
jgi:2-aminoadipate transaminase